MTPIPLAVNDTNILVSSIISPHGNEAQVIDLIRTEHLMAAVSADVLAEYSLILRRPKFRFDPIKVSELLTLFHLYGEHVRPTERLSISSHESDNRLLECAEAANAAYLITGNLRHFPATHGVTRILNARTFLDIFEANA